MSAPKRIQRKRSAGWRMPDGAVYVGRPSKWGNPFIVGADRQWPSGAVRPITHQQAVDLFRLHVGPMGSCEPDDFDAWIAPLRGHDLVCWCPLETSHGEPVPCHADVLLSLANGLTMDEVHENNRRSARQTL